MKLISLDIGLRNLAVVKVEYDSDDDHIIGQDFKDTNINFHVYCKQRSKKDSPVDRCTWIRRIVVGEDLNSSDVVIIERQVQMNVWAMNLMYAMIALINGPEVILFSPLCKFTTFGMPFNTARKAHKKLSVKMALNMLRPIPEARQAFESFTKQDDIADAFNQIITVLWCKNKLPYTRDEMKNRYTSIM
jgi:hypothetical protein